MSTNFTGTWKADLTKSRFVASPPLALLIKIAQSESAIQEELIASKSNGTRDQVVFKCKLGDNPDTAFLNETPIRACARWQGEELCIESWIRLADREMHFCDHWSLSPDAQTLTMEHRNDPLAGQITVLERIE